MSAVLQSPFDPYINQIVAAPNYLSQDNAKALLKCLRETFPSLMQDREGGTLAASPQEMLKKTIKSLSETIDRISTAAITGEGGPNATDLKKLADAQEKQIKILARLSETLTANDRQEALENALIEALDACGNTALKEAFLSEFHKKLAQKSQKLTNLG